MKDSFLYKYRNSELFDYRLHDLNRAFKLMLETGIHEPPWLTLTIRVMISEVEIPSVLSVAQNISFDFGRAYVSGKRYES